MSKKSRRVDAESTKARENERITRASGGERPKALPTVATRESDVDKGSDLEAVASWPRRLRSATTIAAHPAHVGSMSAAGKNSRATVAATGWNPMSRHVKIIADVDNSSAPARTDPGATALVVTAQT